MAQHIALESVGKRLAGGLDEQCADLEDQGHQEVNPMQSKVLSHARSEGEYHARLDSLCSLYLCVTMWPDHVLSFMCPDGAATSTVGPEALRRTWSAGAFPLNSESTLKLLWILNGSAIGQKYGGCLTMDMPTTSS